MAALLRTQSALRNMCSSVRVIKLQAMYSLFLIVKGYASNMSPLFL